MTDKSDLRNKMKPGGENYQEEILKEYVEYGGTARSAINIMRTINVVFNTTNQITAGPKEAILKAILMERKHVINSCKHLSEGQKAILNRYLHSVYRNHLNRCKNKKK